MKPVLITVDDDREVLRAVERDLRRHYGENYRVLRADPPRRPAGSARDRLTAGRAPGGASPYPP